MEPILTFDVSNQHLTRTDYFRVVAKSKNYLKAQFQFQTPDWAGLVKTAIFESKAGRYNAVLENDACMVPWEVLASPGIFRVSVYAGDLITADLVEVTIYETGYQEGKESDVPTPDVYEQLVKTISSKGDTLSYEKNILSLMSGEKVLSKVIITGGSGSREIELQNSGLSIQWRYVGDEDWMDLVLLSDITGAPGPRGQSYLENVKTQMDDVAEANTIYCLGSIEELSIVFPDSANPGEEIAVIWYNAGLPCVLSVSGNVLPVSYVPGANSRSELNALFDGTHWSVLCQETEVIL